MTAEPGRSGRRLRAGLVFFVLFTVLVLVTHIWLLDLPLHWDELGAFVPAALDLHRGGHWIPVSTGGNPHPPGIPAYLAAAWSLTGYSIPATRAAMLLLGAGLAYATFLLAIRLCRGADGFPAFWAVLLLLVSPLYYTQAMMAQLDMPAALFTVLALLLFLDGRIVPAAAVCCVLVMVKETGIAVPAVLGAWLLSEKRWRDCMWFAIPFALLAAWFLCLRASTGHWLGSAGFADYNLDYPLHPFRLFAGFVRRVYALGFADLQWIGTLAIVAGYRKGLFADRAWRVAGSFVAVHLVLVTLLGGAHLERYLLPAWPLFYIAAVRAFAAYRGWRRAVSAIAMACGLLAGLLVNPPYPFPYENNLSMTAFVRLQRIAAEFLESEYPRSRVTTAWPFSDALRRPEFGYVDRAIATREVPDFRPSSFTGIGAGEVDVLVIYSREWDPKRNWMRVGPIEELWRAYFGYERQIDPRECERRFGIRRVARWEAQGQWVEVLARGRGPGTGEAGSREAIGGAGLNSMPARATGSFLLP